MGESLLIPIPFFLNQIWLMLVTIAIEAIIIRKQLQLRRKTSIEYATIINIFSSIFLSLIFIIVYTFINDNLKLQILNYLLWGRLNFLQNINQIFNFSLVTVICFLINASLELQIINLLQNVILPQLLESNLEESELPPQPILFQIFNINDKSQEIKTVIIANFCSMIILIILQYCLSYLL